MYLFLSFSNTEFTLYQKLWDSPYYSEKVDKHDTNFVLNFYLFLFHALEEPARKSFGVEEKRTPLMEARIRRVLSDGVSLVAIDPNQDFKLVGIRTALTISRYLFVQTLLQAPHNIELQTHELIHHFQFRLREVK